MLTVLEAINKSTDYFQKKNIDSPRTNAELLLADILKCKRLDLYLMFDRPLDKDQVDQYREFIARRGSREPLQYIVGKVEFYGLTFHVDKNVLIPRQETEILIESVLNDYKGQHGLKILDIGTGSGNIPVCLVKFLNAEIISIDTSKDALLVAEKNVKYNAVESLVTLRQQNAFELNKQILNFEIDLVVSNPPYVSAEEYKGLQDEITGYEPEMAVTDNSDGYTFYESISATASGLLKESGRIYYEVGQGQAEKVRAILEANGFDKVRTIKDYLDIERVVIGEKK